MELIKYKCFKLAFSSWVNVLCNFPAHFALEHFESMFSVTEWLNLVCSCGPCWQKTPGQLNPLIMATFLLDASLVTPWYYAGWLIMTHHRAGPSFVTAPAPGLSPHYSTPVTENKQVLPLALTTALISSSVPVCNDSSEQYQDPDTEAAKWNSAICFFHYICLIFYYPDM